MDVWELIQRDRIRRAKSRKELARIVVNHLEAIEKLDRVWADIEAKIKEARAKYLHYLRLVSSSSVTAFSAPR